MPMTGTYTVVENQLSGPSEADFGFMQVVEYDVKLFGKTLTTVIHFYYAEFCKRLVGPKPGTWVVDKSDIVETIGTGLKKNGKYIFEVEGKGGAKRTIIAESNGSGGFDFVSGDGMLGGYLDPGTPNIDNVPECP